MAETRWVRSWFWHPSVAVLAAVVALATFVAGMSQTFSDPPLAAAVVAASVAAVASGFYLTVLAPLPAEEGPDYDWWAVGAWPIGSILTLVVIVAAKKARWGALAGSDSDRALVLRGLSGDPAWACLSLGALLPRRLRCRHWSCLRIVRIVGRLADITRRWRGHRLPGGHSGCGCVPASR